MTRTTNQDAETAFHSDIYKDTPGNAEIERLLAKLDSLRRGMNKQIVLISSATTGEGKSTIASRIAKSSAHNRKKPTLLIDYDIRRPRLHEIYQVKKEYGLANMLDLGMHLQDCIQETTVPNLLILTAGISKKNPLTLLRGEAVKKFVEEIRRCYDYVIIDSPPIIPVSDPLILAEQVDDVVLVIKAGKTPRLVVKRAIDMLYDVKVKISGIVLNNMGNVLPYYYDYDYYGYEYYEQKQDNRNDG